MYKKKKNQQYYCYLSYLIRFVCYYYQSLLLPLLIFLTLMLFDIIFLFTSVISHYHVHTTVFTFLKKPPKKCCFLSSVILSFPHQFSDFFFFVSLMTSFCLFHLLFWLLLENLIYLMFLVDSIFHIILLKMYTDTHSFLSEKRFIALTS